MKWFLLLTRTIEVSIHTLYAKVVSISEELLGKPRPLSADPAHSVPTIGRQNLRKDNTTPGHMQVCIIHTLDNGISQLSITHVEVSVTITCTATGWSSNLQHCLSLRILNVEPRAKDTGPVLPDIANNSTWWRLDLDLMRSTTTTTAETSQAIAGTVTTRWTLHMNDLMYRKEYRNSKRLRWLKLVPIKKEKVPYLSVHLKIVHSYIMVNAVNMFSTTFLRNTITITQNLWPVLLHTTLYTTL